jgi:hypothetical protein
MSDRPSDGQLRRLAYRITSPGAFVGLILPALHVRIARRPRVFASDNMKSATFIHLHVEYGVITGISGHREQFLLPSLVASIATLATLATQVAKPQWKNRNGC